MRSELEQKFYDTFGIEPEINYVCDKRPCEKGLLKTCADIGCSHLYDTREDYPEITSEKLLQMICICNSTYINGYTNYFMATGKTKEELKEEILKKCIALSKDINQQIQQLFKEQTNERNK